MIGIEEIIQEFSEAEIEIESCKAEILLRYMNKVLEWNDKVNLTAVIDEQEFLMRHYIDSCSVMFLNEFKDSRSVIDVGTGGGFPGVPLAILNPKKQFTLIDSLNKRVRIVREILHELEIENAEVIHARAEELGRDSVYREKFDVCVSRAVADLSVLSELCIPFIKEGGYFISYKNKDSVEEINKAEKAVSSLGGKKDRIVENKNKLQNHCLVIIEKIKHTPSKYPRRPGIPGKRPIK